ncbi:BRO-N domain-containing protein [Obesumbacterium proteus]|uniref:BRO-N domain-containing protein n=1 Tax=Obesumbacterium proteus TaxID=82983 RepID=UPI00242EE175|nr:BRO family protein [Obesumbacterium proteus]
MSSQVSTSTFSFESHAEIRAIVIDGQPWFVAADACIALRIQNPTQFVDKLESYERSMFNIGRQGKVNIVSESGLYTLILRCRDAMKPGTVPNRFKNWVTQDVLPQIRKTGKYSHTGAETLADLVGTKELAAADKASQVVQSFMPAILEAMKQQEQKYSYPAKPGYREFIHSPEGVTGLAERSYLMNLLRELEENGNDVGGAMMEFTTMVNYITSSYRSIREIQTHAEFIVKQSKLH